MVPDLFERLAKAYAAWPHKNVQNVVWGPWGDGDWRFAFLRNGSPPPTGEKPKPVPEACRKRIEEVQAFEARGYITHAQAQKMINTIVEECV